MATIQASIPLYTLKVAEGIVGRKGKILVTVEKGGLAIRITADNRLTTLNYQTCASTDRYVEDVISFEIPSLGHEFPLHQGRIDGSIVFVVDNESQSLRVYDAWTAVKFNLSFSTAKAGAFCRLG